MKILIKLNLQYKEENNEILFDYQYLDNSKIINKSNYIILNNNFEINETNLSKTDKELLKEIINDKTIKDLSINNKNNILLLMNNYTNYIYKPVNIDFIKDINNKQGLYNLITFLKDKNLFLEFLKVLPKDEKYNHRSIINYIDFANIKNNNLELMYETLKISNIIKKGPFDDIDNLDNIYIKDNIYKHNGYFKKYTQVDSLDIYSENIFFDIYKFDIFNEIYQIDLSKKEHLELLEFINNWYKFISNIYSYGKLYIEELLFFIVDIKFLIEKGFQLNEILKEYVKYNILKDRLLINKYSFYNPFFFEEFLKRKEL